MQLDLLEGGARAAEQPRDAAVDQQRAPALGRPDGRKRLDEGRVGDHRLVLDGLGELEDLEEVGGARGEDGQPVGALGVEAAAAELGLHALEVGAQRGALGVRQRPVLADQAAGAVQQRTHLGAACRGGRELARIEVEEEREDLALAGADARELAEALAGDVVGLHATDRIQAGRALWRRRERARSARQRRRARRGAGAGGPPPGGGGPHPGAGARGGSARPVVMTAGRGGPAVGPRTSRGMGWAPHPGCKGSSPCLRVGESQDSGACAIGPEHRGRRARRRSPPS